MLHRYAGGLAAGLLVPAGALGAGDAPSAAVRGTVNMTAIGMFMVFVVATLCITWWAARRTRTTSDYYAAGGNISGA